MDRIKADHRRSLQLEGVADPVFRPVDIDRSQTGFSFLRSLRIYCFNAGSVIDGHAESDEVLIVVLAGSIELTLSEHHLEEKSPRFNLSAVGNSQGEPCIAYLPPNGAYRLVARSDAEVAYARATPPAGREPTVFSPKTRTENSSDIILFEEVTYPVHLRLQIMQVKPTRENITIMPLERSKSNFEALVHVRSEPAHGAVTISGADREPIALASWDTVTVPPGERPTLHVTLGSSAWLFVFVASP